jgi:transposase
MLVPTRRRTWGPRGKTPVIRYFYKHDKISALAALSVSALRKRMGIYLRFQRKNFKAIHVADFLRRLLRQIRKPIILLWDGGRIHKGPHIAKLLRDNPRLQTERFPAYAPELNPVEFVWEDFKGHTANSLPKNTNHIRQALHRNGRRVCKSQDRLRAFVLASDLPSPPWQSYLH